jgi:hypothetical protein
MIKVEGSRLVYFTTRGLLLNNRTQQVNKEPHNVNHSSEMSQITDDACLKSSLELWTLFQPLVSTNSWMWKYEIVIGRSRVYLEPGETEVTSCKEGIHLPFATKTSASDWLTLCKVTVHLEGLMQAALFGASPMAGPVSPVGFVYDYP